MKSIGYSTSRSWCGINDDYWGAEDNRLFFIADGSGPTYGGYHAPFGIHSTLRHLRSTVADGFAVETRPSTHWPEWLRQALVAQNAALWSLQSAMMQQKIERKKRVPPGPNWFEVEDQFRPPEWAHLKANSFGHFPTSLTAGVLDGPLLTVAQVGSSRCYLWREQSLTLLAKDHLIPSLWEEKAGGPAPDDLWLAHAASVGYLLGAHEELRLDVVQAVVKPGDRILLCSDGYWLYGDRESAVRKVAMEPNLPLNLPRMVDEVATERRSDATVLVLDIHSETQPPSGRG